MLLQQDLAYPLVKHRLLQAWQLDTSCQTPCQTPVQPPWCQHPTEAYECSAARHYVNGAYANYENRREFERELERREERQERQQQQQSAVGRLLTLGQAGQPTGARLKIMRCAQLWPQQKLKGRPLVDLGVGVGYDLDKQVGGRSGPALP